MKSEATKPCAVKFLVACSSGKHPAVAYGSPDVICHTQTPATLGASRSRCYSTVGEHPEGWAKATGHFPLTSLSPSPRFEEIVTAFDGHGECMEQLPDLVPALRRGLAAVRAGQQAVVNTLCSRAPH